METRGREKVSSPLPVLLSHGWYVAKPVWLCAHVCHLCLWAERWRTGDRGCLSVYMHALHIFMYVFFYSATNVDWNTDSNFLSRSWREVYTVHTRTLPSVVTTGRSQSNQLCSKRNTVTTGERQLCSLFTAQRERDGGSFLFRSKTNGRTRLKSQC